ncbi:ATP-binding protein [Streptomyces cadmiisoli]|uniref:ATP-binding protein n=1 Tax=Streptomyces cadmiisoli TaxID=2184053 RepID=UPI00365E181E
MSAGSLPAFPVRTVALAGRIQAARRARHALAQYLSHRGLLRGPDGHRSEQVECALLVVSELVTNACRHTPGPRHLGMAVRGGCLLLEVSDRSRTMPRVVPPEERGASGGFGFGLVAALAEDWTVRTDSRGKAIRVTIPLTA